MKTYFEPSKEIPIKNEVDVLVVGGGPAGFAAAVNSARLGVKTMMIEQSGAVGGVATAGLMSHWTGDTEGPLYEELLDRSKDRSGDFKYYREKVRRWETIINTEKLKTVMLEMLDEACVILQLYTFACEPIMEGNKIKGVITESKSGREAFLSRVVIDASGDGDIAAKAGVPCFKGRESDGKMQPSTLMFKVGGVDMDKAVFPGEFEDTFQVPAGNLQVLGREHLPYPAGHVLLYPTTLPGIVTVNMTNCLDIDGTLTEDLTRSTLACRRQLEPIVEFLKIYVPGFENCYVINSASIIGIRETRHFKGETVITGKDILKARVFRDWIVTKAHFNFDVHNMAGAGLDETGAQKNFPQIKKYTIPYGCFLPEKVDNLFLAGRNISGTHLAHSNFRAMPICINMGQGVGAAAALCVKENTLPRDLEVKKIQDILINQGVKV
ncbi:MAG: FAD-dependent oxidoreductase [Spirochaetes bacterium]|nr:FAD-dependent oxidoreductase [Spirochaetota bacterium]